MNNSLNSIAESLNKIATYLAPKPSITKKSPNKFLMLYWTVFGIASLVIIYYIYRLLI